MKINIDDLTIAQVREIAAIAGGACAAPKTPQTPLPFKVGEALLIRTVTMNLLGKVKAIGRDFLTMEDGGWLADTGGTEEGRVGTILEKGLPKSAEFERAPSWFLVGRGAIVDVFPWTHEIPKVSR